jgi:hypothetical protein
LSASPPTFDYPALVRAAFLGLVKDLLARVAAEGLPGDHHFYVTFGTRESGVSLSPRLLQRFPAEMTIVLQHQFWNLQVEEAAFSVTLRFGGAPERVTVPYEALRAIVDPSANFGLRLAPTAEGADGGAKAEPEQPEDASATPGGAAAGGNVVDFGAFKRKDGEGGR